MIPRHNMRGLFCYLQQSVGCPVFVRALDPRVNRQRFMREILRVVSMRHDLLIRGEQLWEGVQMWLFEASGIEFQRIPLEPSSYAVWTFRIPTSNKSPALLIQMQLYLSEEASRISGGGIIRHGRLPDYSAVRVSHRGPLFNRALDYGDILYSARIRWSASAYAASRSVTALSSAKSATSRYASRIVSSSRSSTMSRVQVTSERFCSHSK